MRTARTIAALLVTLTGCAASTQVLSIGSYQLSDEVLFERVSQAVTAQGYRVQNADPGRGTMTVTANFVPRGIPSVFTIQCYRGGWVTFAPAGAYVRRQGETAKMPRALRDEYESLVMNVMNALGPPGAS